MQRPLRRGTSKAVPIVVSAGLAVGVFCGLLFGVGKKSEAVAAASAKGSAAKPTEEPKPDPTAAPPGHGEAAQAPTTPTAPAAGSATAAAGSAAPATRSAAPAAGSAAPPAGAGATATVVADKKIKLIVTIKPEAAAKDAKLIIDGKEVEGMTVELPADKKSVKVEVKATGYRSVDKKIDLAGGDTAIELEMAKRPSGGTPGVRPPKRPDRPPGNSGGGLIDI
jgi:hypothetical protein